MTTTSSEVADRGVLEPRDVAEDKYHNDLYVRDYPGDVGKIPSSLTEDLSGSVDIIPAGTDMISDFKTRLVQKYAGPFDDFRNIEEGSTNFIYVRAKNLADHEQSGQVNLYWLEASLALRPGEWIHNRIPSSKENEVSVALPKVAPGAISVADAPFAWRPPVEKGHYCLIAQVVTQKTPNPITDKTDIRDFALWVANHAGIAWRNVLFVDLKKNDEEYQIRVTNPSSKDAIFILTGHCIRMPDGTKVSMRIPAAGPRPPVNRQIVVGPDNQLYDNPKTNIITEQTLLPGNYAAKMHVRVEFPPNTKPDRPEFKLQKASRLSRDPAIDAIAISPESVFGRGSAVAAQLEETDERLVRLGDYIIQFR